MNLRDAIAVMVVALVLAALIVARDFGMFRLGH
jgi:preprotein translocase subunit SecE